jgi:hypothetical protein
LPVSVAKLKVNRHWKRTALSHELAMHARSLDFLHRVDMLRVMPLLDTNVHRPAKNVFFIAHYETGR